jgi:LmbE family N-acetylglucosaminyl deacetylase
MLSADRGPTPPTDALPSWGTVLAVVAHPDDESFGLGAVLAAFATAGSTVSLLCLTRGEASTLHGDGGDLAEIRGHELADAARELGIARVELKGHPDGGLTATALDTLRTDVEEALESCGADGIVVFDADGVTGHADHRRATEAAVSVAREHGIPVLGWTVPAEVANTLNQEFGASFAGHDADEIDLVISVDRTTQARAVACHPSQAVPGSVLWRRLELLADREHLRLLAP